MKISLCMIVKNEEKNLSKCLDSIKDYVDEIVIIDTGSNDATKTIASRYTQSIYDFVWCNDFAKARNFSLSKSTNDWVLILDADEVVTSFNKKNFQEITKKDIKVVGRIKRINPFEDGKEVKRYIERVNRFFNKRLFCYEGTIHEQVISKDNLNYTTVSIDIEVEHIGYLDETIKTTNKLERNISMLLDSVVKTPNDPYLHYQLGKSYYKKKDYRKAYESFSKALELCTDFKFEYTQDLVESFGYTLLKCERYKEALKLEKYIKYYGKLPDYNFVMGLIYMNNAKFQEAIDFFKNCIGSKEGKIEGINSYQPNYNIGVIYETLGFKEKALNYYEQCGNYSLAKIRVIELLQFNEKKTNNMQAPISSTLYIETKSNIKKAIEQVALEKAKRLLEECFQITSEDIELYSMKSIVEMMEGNLIEAEKTLKKALYINGSEFDILYNLAYLYELNNQNQLALKMYYTALKVTKCKELKNDVEERIRELKSIESN